MSSGQILGKISDIFRVFKYFQFFLCFWIFLDLTQTEPEPKTSNYPIESNYLRPEPARTRHDPNQTRTDKF